MRNLPARSALLSFTCAMMAITIAEAQNEFPKQFCPPCAAISRAQTGIDGIPEGARKDTSWALGREGVNLGAMKTRALGAGATIVQIDTGVTDHPLLYKVDQSGQGLDVHGADDIFGAGYVNIDPQLSGFLRFPGHGTKTASVIIARPTATDPAHAVNGVATGARLIPVRATQGVVLFPTKIGELEADQHRIAYVLDQAARGVSGFFKQRIDVISMSLGAWPPVESLCASVKTATDAGVIVLAAAGNEVRRAQFPARCPTAIGIAGSTFGQTPWRGSSAAPELAVAAPAEGVWTASVMNGKYCMEASSGTSFAVALTAGVAAEWVAELRRQNRLPASPSEAFRKALMSTARPWKDRSWIGKFGSGIVDMTKLMAQEQRP
jgi:serine protease